MGGGGPWVQEGQKVGEGPEGERQERTQIKLQRLISHRSKPGREPYRCIALPILSRYTITDSPGGGSSAGLCRRGGGAKIKREESRLAMV